MATAVYNSYKANAMRGNINLQNDKIRMILSTSAYSPNIDLDMYYSQLVTSGVETSCGGGYQTSGVLLTNKVVYQDNASNVGIFDADDVVFPSSTIAAKGAVLFKDTGSSATSPLICYLDFGTTRASVNGTYTISWDTSGILNLY